MNGLSIGGTKADGFFPVGHLQVHVYVLSPRTIEDLVAQLEAAVTTIDANMSGRV
jgi:hypothetical protein